MAEQTKFMTQKPLMLKLLSSKRRNAEAATICVLGPDEKNAFADLF